MGRERITKNFETAEETQQFGYELAATLPNNCILALRGDLGAGKTTLVQGLIRGIGVSEPVQSPTFTYLQIYEGSRSVYHFDLYRLPQESDFVLLGFEEYFEAGGIVVIEWPEKIASLLPPSTQWITLSHTPNGRVAWF